VWGRSKLPPGGASFLLFLGFNFLSLAHLAFACHFGGPQKWKDLAAFHITLGAARSARAD
jgi:hypothetical protein